MRLTFDYSIVSALETARAQQDPAVPDVAFLKNDFAGSLQSFFATIERAVGANPVPMVRLKELSAKAQLGTLTEAETQELQGIKVQALRQGRAVATVIGFFLKFKAFDMLAEVRKAGKLFQPVFGPVLVVDGDAVRDVFRRDQEFTVDPYGVEMKKVMSPAYNGGFDTFILSTDNDPVYEPDKRLLTAVCTREDAQLITTLVHEECMRRVEAAVAAARSGGGRPTIDVVQALARFVPVTLGHRYLGVPVAAQPGTFELTPEMLKYYGTAIEGQTETALTKTDGVIPDETVMYGWIKAAFQHFFNNVQKDPVVQAQGLRACRQLLAYLLREVGIQRKRIIDGLPVEDTMLTRLVRFQLGKSTPTARRPFDLDPRLVSDLRIAENVMGTIVGAVAGQEESTCRVVDALLRLKEGEYPPPATPGARAGTFAEAAQMARNIVDGTDVHESRATLHQYCLEALRLRPQGEVLLRRCATDGARIAEGRPMSAGTLIFASHGSAMKDVPDPDSFVLDRPREHYLQYGWSRHACLGQHVSPVIIVESLIALLSLQDLTRPEPRAGETAFPFERRFGHLQFDDQNLYATTFTLAFS